MNKGFSNIILIVVIAVFVVGAGLGVFYYQKSSEEMRESSQSVPEAAETKEFNPQAAGSPNPRIVQTPPACCSHPYYHSVYRAVSSDGISWTKTDGLLKNRASVPAILQREDGSYILYYVDGVYDTMDCSVSQDGVNFSAGNCRIYGFTEEKAWDPYVVKLDDGFYRMYFFAPDFELFSNRIMSAISKDGINWLQEEGIRFEKQGIFDPVVIKMGNMWRMYVWYRDEPSASTIVSAASQDGLNFIKEKEFKVGGGVPEVVKLDSGQCAIYYCANGIEVRTSADCLNWGLGQIAVYGEAGKIVCDPSVIKNLDGQWLMYYKVQ